MYEGSYLGLGGLGRLIGADLGAVEEALKQLMWGGGNNLHHQYYHRKDPTAACLHHPRGCAEEIQEATGLKLTKKRRQNYLHPK